MINIGKLLIGLHLLFSFGAAVAANSEARLEVLAPVSLSVTNLFGNISIIGSANRSLVARASAKGANASVAVRIETIHQGKIFLRLEATDVESAELVVYFPERMLANLMAESEQGDITVEGFRVPLPDRLVALNTKGNAVVHHSLMTTLAVPEGYALGSNTDCGQVVALESPAGRAEVIRKYSLH